MNLFSYKSFAKLISLQYSYSLAKILCIWLMAPCLALFIYGLYGGLYLAPADYQQGDAFRIIYVHVPCALMSLMIYSAMASFAAIAFIWRIKLYDYLMMACAPVGAWMTFLALITGAIWGKPMWGAYWVWDARLTSELLQLFLYWGVIALNQALEESPSRWQMTRILVLVGFINIPIIHFSVSWWNTLHQGDTLHIFGPSLIAPMMLHPLIAMIAAFGLFCIIAVMLRLRHIILEQESQAKWIEEVVCK